jgi:hypothetical protein
MRAGIVDDADLAALDRDLLDVARFHLVEEGGIRHGHVGRPVRRSLEQVEQPDQQDQDDDQENYILAEQRPISM